MLYAEKMEKLLFQLGSALPFSYERLRRGTTRERSRLLRASPTEKSRAIDQQISNLNFIRLCGPQWGTIPPEQQVAASASLSRAIERVDLVQVDTTKRNIDLIAEFASYLRPPENSMRLKPKVVSCADITSAMFWDIADHRVWQSVRFAINEVGSSKIEDRFLTPAQDTFFANQWRQLAEMVNSLPPYHEEAAMIVANNATIFKILRFNPPLV